MKKDIQTKHTEKRFKTSKILEMRNNYAACDIKRKWSEDFRDEDTGEVVSIDRYEVVIPRGTKFDDDTISHINFFLQSGDIKEVELSNQCRTAVEKIGINMGVYLASAIVADKPQKFLLYANSLDEAIEILRDFIELNYTGFFWLNSIKEYVSAIIIKDNLTKEEEKDEAKKDFKFYQIEVVVCFIDGQEHQQTFIVETYNTDKAMKLISQDISKRLEEHNEDREFTLRLETCKLLPCSLFIDKEFSQAYNNKNEVEQ